MIPTYMEKMAEQDMEEVAKETELLAMLQQKGVTSSDSPLRKDVHSTHTPRSFPRSCRQ